MIKGDIQMNETTKLTQDEAEQLLKMLKDALTNHIVFPEKGDSIEFDVQGTTKKDLFTIKIYRGSINKSKYDIGARIKKNNIHLLELHISENKVHYNPDGTKIIGSHWHVYSEEYGRKFAFPAENIESAKFVENTVMFLDEFHVIQKPEISFQLEIV